MRRVWVIRQVHHLWGQGGRCEDVPVLYGKGDTAIREDQADDLWLATNGYDSEGAANRQRRNISWRKNLPWSCYGATVESRDVAEPAVKYEIRRCYEITITDADGNPIRHEFCYGDRKEAESDARWFAGLEEKDRKDYGEAAWKEGR